MGNRVAQKLSFRNVNPKKSENFNVFMFFPQYHDIMATPLVFRRFFGS